MHKGIGIALLVLALVGLPAGAATIVEMRQLPPRAYTVQAGDSLAAIGWRLVGHARCTQDVQRWMDWGHVKLVPGASFRVRPVGVVLRADDGDRWADLASTHRGLTGAGAAAWLAAWNGSNATAPIAAGQLIAVPPAMGPELAAAPTGAAATLTPVTLEAATLVAELAARQAARRPALAVPEQTISWMTNAPATPRTIAPISVETLLGGIAVGTANARASTKADISEPVEQTEELVASPLSAAEALAGCEPLEAAPVVVEAPTCDAALCLVAPVRTGPSLGCLPFGLVEYALVTRTAPDHGETHGAVAAPKKSPAAPNTSKGDHWLAEETADTTGDADSRMGYHDPVTPAVSPAAPAPAASIASAPATPAGAAPRVSAAAAAAALPPMPAGVGVSARRTIEKILEARRSGRSSLPAATARAPFVSKAFAMEAPVRPIPVARAAIASGSSKGARAASAATNGPALPGAHAGDHAISPYRALTLEQQLYAVPTPAAPAATAAPAPKSVATASRPAATAHAGAATSGATIVQSSSAASQYSADPASTGSATIARQLARVRGRIQMLRASLRPRDVVAMREPRPNMSWITPLASRDCGLAGASVVAAAEVNSEATRNSAPAGISPNMVVVSQPRRSSTTLLARFRQLFRRRAPVADATFPVAAATPATAPVVAAAAPTAPRAIAGPDTAKAQPTAGAPASATVKPVAHAASASTPEFVPVAYSAVARSSAAAPAPKAGAARAATRRLAIERTGELTELAQELKEMAALLPSLRGSPGDPIAAELARVPGAGTASPKTPKARRNKRRKAKATTTAKPVAPVKTTAAPRAASGGAAAHSVYAATIVPVTAPEPSGAGTGIYDRYRERILRSDAEAAAPAPVAPPSARPTPAESAAPAAPAARASDASDLELLESAKAAKS